MSEMVERVANVLMREGIGFTATKDDAEAMARAAIASMREPTEAMVKAGFDEDNLYRHPSESWPAMIDAALAERDTNGAD